eukprot:TRINITY_DN107309_c0_g1_i1.p1 TRINITY_DN107309_c0_g1~~TRINITY_DN107309_c0_g1_i1.p1  ORF type:complete len:376 (+),score=56.12 TRINITY_DN107309_c0_g1_i1:150-1277(+)
MRSFRSRGATLVCLGGAMLTWQWLSMRSFHTSFTLRRTSTRHSRNCRTASQRSATRGDPQYQASTLLVATEADLASMTLLQGLLNHSAFDWEACGASKWRARSIQDEVYLWHRSERLSELNGIDEEWSSSVRPLTDMIFLSRHQASSGKPSLTVHPIGNPRRDLEPHGGVAGKFSPPSPRLASLLRNLVATRSLEPHASLSDFDVSFEATHHGPLVNTPAAFVEIGSAESEWARIDAGACWAETLWNALSGSEAVEDDVLVVAGGSHYMPQIKDLIDKHPELAVGHMLPSYIFQDASEPVLKSMVCEALATTVAAHPHAKRLLLYMSKKMLKLAVRQQVMSAVESCEPSLGPAVAVVNTAGQLAEKLQPMRNHAT